MTESPRGSQPVRTPAPTGRYPRPSTSPQPTPRKLDTRDRFRRAHETAKSSVGPWASDETKYRWLNEHSQLWLHKAETKPGKYGQRWVLSLSEGAANATICYLGLAANGWRDQLFEAIEADLAADPSPIGPLALTQFETDGPNPAWDLVEWEAEDGTTNF